MTDENEAFVEALSGESTRGAILITAARLHAMLQTLVLEFVPNRRSAEQLMLQGGAADSFSAHILVASMLGLVDDEVKTDLNIIRKIRNWTAHHVDECHWDHAEVGPRCDSLRLPVTGKVKQHAERTARRCQAYLFTSAYITGAMEARVGSSSLMELKDRQRLGAISYSRDNPADHPSAGS